MSLRLIVFEIYARKIEKLSISQEIDLLPLITWANIDLGSKNGPLVVIVESNRLFFSLCSTMLIFETF